MKKIFCLLATLALGLSAFGQSAHEIISRMDEEMGKHDNTIVAFTLDMKIPIIGSFTSTARSYGDKIRMEMDRKGDKVTTWLDADTQWEYDSKKNEITVTRRDQKKESEAQEDLAMLSGIEDGYDVSIKSETAQAWTILCKKSKDNKDKDDAKKMELVVAKGSYMPVSLKAKVSGITITIRNLSFDVTEEQVTFNPDAYPGVPVIDKR